MDNPSMILRTRAGRLRLGWRILLFLVIAIVATGGIMVTLPAGIVWESLSALLGAVVAGWAVVLEPAGARGTPRERALAPGRAQG